MITFKPLSEVDRLQLENALRANAETQQPIHMDPKDTSFIPINRIEGLLPDDPLDDAEVIRSIKSVPVHYS